MYACRRMYSVAAILNTFDASLCYFHRNYKYNKLVLAQHLDDLAESFIMSALHNGQVFSVFFIIFT
jgi:hypothetical protein